MRRIGSKRLVMLRSRAVVKRPEPGDLPSSGHAVAMSDERITISD